MSTEQNGRRTYAHRSRDGRNAWHKSLTDWPPDAVQIGSQKSTRATMNKRKTGRAPKGKKDPSTFPTENESSETPAADAQETHEPEFEVSDAVGEGEKETGEDGQDKHIRFKKSCHLKDEAEESLVLDWVAENELLWNSKHKEYKLKTKKDRLWQEKAEELGLDGKCEFLQ